MMVSKNKPIKKPWRHSAHDGRGCRDVFFNGAMVDRVIYADERRGFIIRYVYPYQILGKGNHQRVRTIRESGIVCVFFKGDLGGI